MSLSSIKGQDKALKIISGMMKRGRVPSAMLFAGDSGIGKRTAAINFAKALNCISPIESSLGSDCCDKCSSCRSIDAMSHPDIKIIRPEENEIKIEHVRDIVEMLSLKALSAAHRVVIIDDAEAMNSNAANAFLKTLEEPPQNSLIILVSGAPDSLPDTVRSRCLAVRFYPLPPELCREVAAGNLDLADADTVLRLAMGRPGIALAGNLLEDIKWFSSILDDIKRNETKSPWQDRNEIRQWLDIAMLMIRDHAMSLITSDSSIRSIWKDALPRGLKGDHEAMAGLFFRLQSIRALIDSNLNKPITWNYVSSIMRMHMANS